MTDFATPQVRETNYADTTLNHSTAEDRETILEKDFQTFLFKIKKMSREDYFRKHNEFVETHGTPEEARACEVSSQKRLKDLEENNANLVPQKKSLGVDVRGIFRLQYRKDGTIKTESLGRELPSDFDLSQYSISPSARRVLGI